MSDSVTQARGRFIANGFGGESVACTGSLQTILVTVNAQSGAFKRGTALVDAQLGSCNFSCNFAEDSEEVSLTR